MKVPVMCLFALLVLLAAQVVGDVPNPPSQFELRQNVPNPFCADTSVAGHSATEIRFALPRQAEIRLTVWSPDTADVVRTLVYGVLPAGYYTIVWDGRDENGQLVGNGDYPYSLVASETGGEPILFEATLTATVSCTTTGVENATWGALKSLLGD